MQKRCSLVGSETAWPVKNLRSNPQHDILETTHDIVHACDPGT